MRMRVIRTLQRSCGRWTGAGEMEEMSGIALRQMRVDRGYQYALDEARERAAQFGIFDDRIEVVEHWREAKSWFAAPVLVAGEVLGSSGGYELLVAYTRLGNLLGMLDREEIAEAKAHLVWVGRPISLELNLITVMVITGETSDLRDDSLNVECIGDC
jgi:hypothetical protein